jgi:imidazolonepropionase-like amidohydrolase
VPASDGALAGLGAPSSGDTLEFSVLVAGRAVGRLRQWPDTSGTVTTSYTYDDQGRGPALRQTLKVDKAGIPVAMQLAGSNELRGAVREMIEPGPGPLVTWRNDNAAGRVTPGRAYYLPLETMPSDVAALTRALLRAKTRVLPLLPEGVARLVVGASRTVTGVAGPIRITAYEVLGLGLTSQLLWLDGADRLFALGSSRHMVVRRGYEPAAPTLVQVQTAASQARLAALARRLSRTPRGPVAFVHVKLFDAVAKRMVPAQTVIVRGDRVVAAGADGSVAIPRDAEVIDGTGKSLLPGLWDMHAQLEDDDGLLHLAGGVTTVRDLAADSDERLGRRTRFDEGTLLGPHVIMAGERERGQERLLNFLTDSAIDTRSLGRFTDVARLAGSIDLRSERVERFIKRLQERNVAVDPTLNRFEALFTFRSGTLNDATLPVAQRMPAVARRGQLTGGLPVTPALEPIYRASFINVERLVRRLHEAGVPIIAGSDGLAGFALHRELELYSEANIPNLDILYIATLGAATVMQQSAQRGSLAVGRIADLVLVDGDPSQRMRDLRRMELVMKGGVIYLPDSLYAAVGVKPAPRKGAIPTREIRATDVVCRGAAGVTKNGAPAPLDCSVIDSTTGTRSRRTPAPRARRPRAAPVPKKP